MRVLFLDFDGVLNSHAWMERQPPTTNFLRAVDPEAVARLAEVIRRTGARIVVSSTWRILNSLANLRGVLIEAGFPPPCPIIGATPRLHRTPEGAPRYRGHEIQQWLDEAGAEVQAFAIVDDDSDMVHLTPRLVQTNFERGLQDEHVEALVALLLEGS